jgi:hypothetical protein
LTFFTIPYLYHQIMPSSKSSSFSQTQYLDRRVFPLPYEIKQLILNFVLAEWDTYTGWGLDSVGRLRLVSKGWKQWIEESVAKVPKAPKRRRDGSIGRRSFLVPEAFFGSILYIPQVLIWHDLQHAQKCIQANLKNVSFWKQFRAILLDFRKDRRVHPAENDPRSLRIGHSVFTSFLDALDYCRANGEPLQIQWIRINMTVWQGIGSIHDPGMFPLSRLSGIPHLRFRTPPGHPLSYFIPTEIQQIIIKRARQPIGKPWIPTGIENANPRGGTSWRDQALRKKLKRKRETDDECFLRFLVTKYRTMYKNV